MPHPQDGDHFELIDGLAERPVVAMKGTNLRLSGSNLPWADAVT